MTASAAPDIALQPGTQAFLQDAPKLLLIGGEWVPAASGETFESINPATAAPLVSVALAGASDVDRAVQAARRAFESGPWPGLSGTERGNLPGIFSEQVFYRVEIVEIGYQRIFHSICRDAG